jgi:hypothetical protein
VKAELDPFPDGFLELKDYAEQLSAANQGSMVLLETSKYGVNEVFYRFFASFSWQGELSKVCAPVLSLDACHLKHDGWAQYRYILL